MQTTIFKQKSSYWRVFALCFFTAVLLFAPHCIVDAVAGGGYFHYAGDFNDQQINFYQYANAFVKNGGSFSWATDLGSVRPNLTSTRAGDKIEFLDLEAPKKKKGDGSGEDNTPGGGGNEGGGGDEEAPDPTV